MSLVPSRVPRIYILVHIVNRQNVDVLGVWLFTLLLLFGLFGNWNLFVSILFLDGLAD